MGKGWRLGVLAVAAALCAPASAEAEQRLISGHAQH